MLRSTKSSKKKDDSSRRLRPASNRKAFDLKYVINAADLNSSGQQVQVKEGTFGRKWAKTFKNQKAAMPSYVEVMDGIELWYVNQVKERFRDRPNHVRQVMVVRVRATFKALREAVNIDSESASRPMMKRADSTATPGNDQLELCNPYSLITCLVLYLYSMEFGDPPLYSEINRVTRTMDTSQLRALGPFAQAFSCIINSVSHYFEEDDQGKTGFSLHYMHGGAEENVGGIYMLHNGTVLEEAQQQALVSLPSSSYLTIDTSTTFSHDLSAALTFAFGAAGVRQSEGQI